MAEDVNSKIEEFFSRYRLRKYAKGQVLVLGGEQTEYVYYLVEGRVKKYDVAKSGDEIILNTFKPPAFFPMSLAINKGANLYVYEAETSIRIRQAPADEVVAFLKINPEVMYDLLSRVYRGIDGMLGRMTYLMTSSAKNRLAYELLIEARRFGTKQADKSYSLDVSEKDLGARAGLTRETVNREIAKLKTEGLISLSNGAIHIKDLVVLEAKLNQEV